MVNDPLEEMARWKKIGQVKRALVHYETISDHVNRALAAIEGYCWQKSLVLNPDTDIKVIEPYTNQLFGIMFMGVRPGFQGQAFISSVLQNITAVKKKYPYLFLEIDGGVNEKTIPALVKAGIDAICPGSAVFKNEKAPQENIEQLKNIIAQLTNTV
jgi:ribulose-phosphate 3-epimerase